MLLIDYIIAIYHLIAGLALTLVSELIAFDFRFRRPELLLRLFYAFIVAYSTIEMAAPATIVAVAAANAPVQKSVVVFARVTESLGSLAFLVHEAKHNAWFFPCGKIETTDGSKHAALRIVSVVKRLA